LPVPLNSSKITSSILLPVSTSAVPMMVSDAAFLDVAGGAEEPLGFLQRVGVDTAGEDLAGVRNLGVVGPGEAGDRVEQDDHVPAVLDETAGLLDDHVRDLHVPARRFVEGGADHLGFGVPFHVGDFFRSLVDEQDDDIGFGWLVVMALAIFWSRTVLPVRGGATISIRWPMPIGVDQIHDAHVRFAWLGLEQQALVGVQRVRSSKLVLVGDLVGSAKLIASTRSNAK
jgi:hypothetical protein